MGRKREEDLIKAGKGKDTGTGTGTGTSIKKYQLNSRLDNNNTTTKSTFILVTFSHHLYGISNGVGLMPLVQSLDYH